MSADSPGSRSPPAREADLFSPLKNGRIQCTACARRCQIGEGQIGLCGIRGVVGGKLYLLNYGRIIAGHVDPIEKKPVIHYRPGSKIFSIATTGCTWLCRYCQNEDISQRRKIEGVEMSPQGVVDLAVKNGCEGIAYTYNEPSIFMEYARDVGKLAHKKRHLQHLRLQRLRHARIRGSDGRVPRLPHRRLQGER